MKSELDIQIDKLKEKLNEEAEEHFRAFAAATKRERFTINDMERLMMENQKRMKEIMTEANEELVGSVEVEVKKNAQNAEARWSEPKGINPYK